MSKLNNYFSSIFDLHNGNEIYTSPLDATELNRFIDSKIPDEVHFYLPPITNESVTSFIHTLHTSKATGLDNQSDVIIEACNSISRYLDDLLNIDNNFFDCMVVHVYPSELQLNKANVSATDTSFLDLQLSILDGFVKTKKLDKRDDFDCDIVNFQFLNGDVPLSTSYGVCISQLIRFARVSSHVGDFKLLRQ